MVMKKTAMKNTAFIISVILLSLALAFCVLGILLLPFSIVHADSEQDVIFAPVSNLEGNEYASASSIVLVTADEIEFCIPESYYIANVHHAVANYYLVSYCGFDDKFFVKSNEAPKTTKVTFSDDVALSPDVKLTLKIGEELTFGTTTVNNDYTIKLLGYKPDDPTQIFISATTDGTPTFGFASVDSFLPFSVPYHPVSQAEREQILSSKYQPNPDNGDIIPNTSLALRIVLIIGICVPALVIAILLFKPSKNDRSQGKNTLRKSRKRDDFDYDSARTYARPDGYDDGYDRGYSRGYNDARGYDNYPQNRDNQGSYDNQDNRDWRN